MTHNCIHVLSRGTSSPSVVKRVCFACQKAKGNACWYLKVIGKRVDLVLYPGVVIQHVTIKIAKF